MLKSKIIALVAAGIFAAGTAFAGDGHEGCAKNVDNKDKASCNVNFAKLDLTADQKTKLEAAKADCDKAGWTKESTNAFLTKAEGILSKEQYSKLKAECDKAGEKKETKA